MATPKSPELSHVLEEVSERHNDKSKWKRTVLQVSDLDAETGWSGAVGSWTAGEKLSEGAIFGKIMDSKLMSDGESKTFRLQVQHKKGGHYFWREFTVHPAGGKGGDSKGATERAMVTHFSRNVGELSKALIESHRMVNETMKEGAAARKQALDEREEQFSKFVALFEGIADYGFVPLSTLSLALSIMLLKKADVDPMEFMGLINEAISRAEITLKSAARAVSED